MGAFGLYFAYLAVHNVTRCTSVTFQNGMHVPILFTNRVLPWDKQYSNDTYVHIGYVYLGYTN